MKSSNMQGQIILYLLDLINHFMIFIFIFSIPHQHKKDKSTSFGFLISRLISQQIFTCLSQ